MKCYGGFNVGIGNAPIVVLNEETERQRGKGAQESNIQAARTISDAVRSTLGPKGMDKMMVDSMGDVVITNDGVTILKEMDIEHPAANMLVEVAKAQDDESGDGTTSATVLAGELLKQALEMIDSNVHPTIIAKGYRMASEKAIEELEDIGISIDEDDEQVLKHVAMTAMISKAVSGSRDYLADLAVDVVKSIADKTDGKFTVDMDNVQMVNKEGGSVDDMELVDGIIINKEPVHPGMPRAIEDVKIILLNSALEAKKTEIDSDLKIEDPSQMQAFLDEEEKMLKDMVTKIKAAGANVVFCQKGIDDLVQHYLSKEGILAVRRVKKSDMEKLSKSTQANIVNSLDELEEEDLGKADLVESKKIQEEDMTFVTGCHNPKAVSLLLRGGTEHVVDETERSMVDALNVVAVSLEDGQVVAGGGAPQIELALKIRDYAATVGGREQLAIEAYADALEVIPTALSENAGLDSIDVLIELRKAHKDGEVNTGVEVESGEIVDMCEEEVVDPLRVIKQAINSATEVAVMITRIDDVIASKGGPAPGEGAPPGAGGGPPGGGGMPPGMGGGGGLPPGLG